MKYRNAKVVAALAATALAATLTAAAPSVADQHTSVVAQGLNNPRHLSFDGKGNLYIAESGANTGTGTCIEHPELGQVCLDNSGSVTRVSAKGQQKRVVTGLASIGGAEGATGPSDVIYRNGKYVIVMGLGGNTEIRGELGKAAKTLGTVLSVTPKKKGKSVKILADVAKFEHRKNPDGGFDDSNPVDLAVSGKNWVVTDAGMNAVLNLSAKGKLSTKAVLQAVLVNPPPFPAPPELGEWPDPFPAEPVPTAAAKGPDGKWYISQLTGFPFEQGAASIWRVGRNGQLTLYATGLTNVTDLAWKGRTLYAVQISDVGLLNEAGLPSGSLVKVSRTGAHTTVADNLPAPYGVAIRKGSAYVTTCSVCVGGGEVLKVRLG